MDEIEQKAREFAERVHGDQRYGDQPYVTHLAAVRAVLADFGFGGDLGVAAWLHDAIEDTETSRERIIERFGDEVAGLVWAVTGIGKNRKERTACAYEKMRALPQAIILKLADRIANVEASAKTSPRLLDMYRKEWASFQEALSVASPSDPQVVAMWERLRRTLLFF